MNKNAQTAEIQSCERAAEAARAAVSINTSSSKQRHHGRRWREEIPSSRARGWGRSRSN